MKQFAIIGLGTFGIGMLEELVSLTDEIIIVDKDKDIIEKYKDQVHHAYICDAINEQALQKIIPTDIDAAIVDLGGKVELSLLVVNYLKRLGVKDVITKAQTSEHGEILTLVGASKVVYPDLEAAKRIAPMLASSLLFNFMPISESLALAEVLANEHCVGKTLVEANLRKLFGINVVAIRTESADDFSFIKDLSYRFRENDILLVAGTEENIFRFSREKARAKKESAFSVFKRHFPGKAKE
jgi:trk system potassium uptake protein